MRRSELTALLDTLRESCTERGTRVEVDLGKQASSATLEECETVLGLTLPPSLSSFLSEWNGMTIRYYSGNEQAINEWVPWIAKFQILDADLITKATLAIREFLDDAGESPVAPPGTGARGRQLLAVSDENDIMIYLAIDRRDRSEECPVMVLDQVYYDDWLDEPGSPIAANIDDHVRRSLETIIRTAKTFKYWGAPPERGE